MALRRTQPDPGSPAILEPMRGGHRRAAARRDGARRRHLEHARLRSGARGGRPGRGGLLRAGEAAGGRGRRRSRVRGRGRACRPLPRAAGRARVARGARARTRCRRGCSSRSGATSTATRSPAPRVHLGESAEELELLEHGHRAMAAAARGSRRVGRGVGRARLRARRIPRSHAVPRGSGPCRPCACSCRARNSSALAARRATVVTCPRSNRHVGVGDPPVEAFYAAGVAVAVGTDSRASAPDLSIWPELAAMRRLAPGVPARAAARERDAGRRRGARVRRRVRHHRAWQARGARRRLRAREASRMRRRCRSTW